MAFMRSLSTRANLLRRGYNQPAFSYVLHENSGDDRERTSPAESAPPSSLQGLNGLLRQQRSFASSPAPFGFFRGRRCSAADLALAPPSIGADFCRNMSTVPTIGDGVEKIELIGDVAGVLTESSAQDLAAQAAPVVNEVAIAAADSYLPVWALQHLIDAVHTFTGFNWWASIVVSTLLIRMATVPLLINTLKTTSKLTLLRPRLLEVQQQVKDQGMDPTAIAQANVEMKKLFKEYGVTPYSPLKGLFIQGPVFVSFFFAISNMVEKVPSFKTGGTSWFLDLTTQDSLYIFPVLTALTFLITVECNMQEGMEGNPTAGTMKKFSRVLALLTVPFTMSFPKAVFCYWVTSNLFSLTYGLVLKVPGVKKSLGVPEIPVDTSAPTPQSQSPFDMFPALKQALEKKKEIAPSLPLEPSLKQTTQKASSSSVISQRLRSLEKQVKGRKRNKKTRG